MMQNIHSASVVLLPLLAVLLVSHLSAAPAEVVYDANKDTLVYVGTSGGANARGIYVYKLQPGSADAPGDETLVPMGLAAATQRPSFLAIDAKRRLLFAANEINSFNGEASGAVSAFRIEATGMLTLLNQQSSVGTGPCQIVLDRAGRNLLAANYSGGSVAVIPVAADGTLGQKSAFIQHTGSSADPARQKGPHAHCVTLDAANHFAFVCDLGLDQVLTYRFDADKGTLAPGDPPFTKIKPGAGPRHMVFSAGDKFAYVVNEMASTISVLASDVDAGRLSELQTVSSLPPDHTGPTTRPNTGAEIAIAPGGKFLYASNRGANVVSLFAVDTQTGLLKFIQATPTGGKTPRYFGIDPTGEHLIIANQDSDSLMLCGIDKESGKLTPTADMIGAPRPTCAVFLPPRNATTR